LRSGTRPKSPPHRVDLESKHKKGGWKGKTKTRGVEKRKDSPTIGENSGCLRVARGPPLVARPATPLMTDLGLSIHVSMFEHVDW